MRIFRKPKTTQKLSNLNYYLKIHSKTDYLPLIKQYEDFRVKPSLSQYEELVEPYKFWKNYSDLMHHLIVKPKALQLSREVIVRANRYDTAGLIVLAESVALVAWLSRLFNSRSIFIYNLLLDRKANLQKNNDWTDEMEATYKTISFGEKDEVQYTSAQFHLRIQEKCDLVTYKVITEQYVPAVITREDQDYAMEKADSLINSKLQNRELPQLDELETIFWKFAFRHQ
jgi:hypothetical protein